MSLTYELKFIAKVFELFPYSTNENLEVWCIERASNWVTENREEYVFAEILVDLTASFPAWRLQWNISDTSDLLVWFEDEFEEELKRFHSGE